MSMCSVFLCCCKRVFAMTSAFSWQNSISLCPASFCIPRPNLPVIPGISGLPTFAFQSPMMKRTSFLVLVLEGLVGLHEVKWTEVAQSCLTLCDPRLLRPWDSPGKNTGVIPFPSPGDLPDPGIEPGSPTLEADTLTSEPPGKPWWVGLHRRSLELFIQMGTLHMKGRSS